MLGSEGKPGELCVRGGTSPVRAVCEIRRLIFFPCLAGNSLFFFKENSGEMAVKFTFWQKQAVFEADVAGAHCCSYTDPCALQQVKV